MVFANCPRSFLSLLRIRGVPASSKDAIRVGGIYEGRNGY